GRGGEARRFVIYFTKFPVRLPTTSARRRANKSLWTFLAPTIAYGQFHPPASVGGVAEAMREMGDVEPNQPRKVQHETVQNSDCRGLRGGVPRQHGAGGSGRLLQ